MPSTTHRQPHHGPYRPRRGMAGLTLVEAVAGLLVLGVLAAVALPRYADVQAKSREARVRAVAQSLRVVAAAARAQAEAQGISCAADDDAQVRIDDVTVPLRHCLPRAKADLQQGLLAAVGLATADAWVARGVQTAGATGATAQVGALSVQAADAPDPTLCAAHYREPAAPGEPAEIGVTLSGC